MKEVKFLIIVLTFIFNINNVSAGPSADKFIETGEIIHSMPWKSDNLWPFAEPYFLSPMAPELYVLSRDKKEIAAINVKRGNARINLKYNIENILHSNEKIINTELFSNEGGYIQGRRLLVLSDDGQVSFIDLNDQKGVSKREIGRIKLKPGRKVIGLFTNYPFDALNEYVSALILDTKTNHLYVSKQYYKPDVVSEPVIGLKSDQNIKFGNNLNLIGSFPYQNNKLISLEKIPAESDFRAGEYNHLFRITHLNESSEIMVSEFLHNEAKPEDIMGYKTFRLNKIDLKPEQKLLPVVKTYDDKPVTAIYVLMKDLLKEWEVKRIKASRPPVIEKKNFSASNFCRFIFLK